MADPYRANLARNRYFQDMEYGEWYDGQMAYDRQYKKWADEVNARNEWARRHRPNPGSYEEHMAGLGAWAYEVDPRGAWWYRPTPIEGRGRGKDWDWDRARGRGCWWLDEVNEDYEFYWPRKRREREYCARSRRARGRRERAEYVYPERSRHTYPKYEFVDAGRRVRKGIDYVVPAQYLFGGSRGRWRKLQHMPRFHSKGFKVKRKWKDWPEVYDEDHPERHGIKVKTKWRDWPKVLII